MQDILILFWSKIDAIIKCETQVFYANFFFNFRFSGKIISFVLHRLTTHIVKYFFRATFYF